MKIIILGAGQVGRTAAYQLSREQANAITVVDTNDEILRDLQDRLDIRTVVGNTGHPAILEAAGCETADMIVALTNSDEVNMVACQVAHTLFGTPTKIARIRVITSYSIHYTKLYEIVSPATRLPFGPVPPRMAVISTFRPGRLSKRSSVGVYF